MTAPVTPPDSSRWVSSLAPLLAQRLAGRICILGVGNRLSGDDAVGPTLIDAVTGRVDAVCLDGGTAPENLLGKVVLAAPDTLLIVDAVTMDALPGEARVVDSSGAGGGGLSTHGLPLAMLCEYLHARRPMQIVLLGIQPVSTGLGCPMSPVVHASVRSLAALLARLLPVSA